MTWAEAIAALQQKLLDRYDFSEAKAIAQTAFTELFAVTTTEIRLHGTTLLTADEITRWHQMAATIASGKPLQYALGYAYFYNKKLSVNEAVLIPRPETEELVEWILQEAQRTNDIHLLDIGTGSGCIPIILASQLKSAHVYALDISSSALTVAKQNALSHQVQIEFHEANILDFYSLPPLPLFDIIVSNPPYIPEADAESMHNNVLEHEPHLALFVPNDQPLIFYEAIGKYAQQQLKPNGKLYFEIAHQMGEKLVALLTSLGYQEVILKKDMHGNDRMIAAKK